MRCLNPRRVGFEADGKTISWNGKNFSKEYAPFLLPCGKCLECRLNYARENSIRCWHESRLYLDNCFITLTYDDKSLKSPRLQYSDFQLFMKRLRSRVGHQPWQRLGFFATGEYGDKKKRPHWHALIFNWQPPDMRYLRKNERGDILYTSSILDELWGYNDALLKPNEIGSVTLDSAGYCARYASKKLVHGKDQDHDFHPVHKRSTRPGIGKNYCLKYYRDFFNIGKIDLGNGLSAPIPRYYERLIQKHDNAVWREYLFNIKLPQALSAESKFNIESHEESVLMERRAMQGKFVTHTKCRAKKLILEQNFNRLQQARQGE